MPFSCSISSLSPSSSLQSVMVPHTCIMHIPALLAMEGNTLWHMMRTERIEDLGVGSAAHFQLDGYPAFVVCFLSLILASFSPTVYLLAGLFFCVLTQCITPCLSMEGDPPIHSHPSLDSYLWFQNQLANLSPSTHLFLYGFSSIHSLASPAEPN